MTPTFEMNAMIRDFLRSATTRGPKQVTPRPRLQAQAGPATKRAVSLIVGRSEPANDVWRALASFDERPSVSDPAAKADPRMEFMLMREMGHTTKEGLEALRGAQRELPHLWRTVRASLPPLDRQLELMSHSVGTGARDDERKEMLTDLREMIEKFGKWLDELAPPIPTGAPRIVDADYARVFAGAVFATLRKRGMSASELIALVTESNSSWSPAPIRTVAMRELSRGRRIRDQVTALVREGISAGSRVRNK